MPLEIEDLIVKLMDSGLNGSEAAVLSSWISSSRTNKETFNRYIDIFLSSGTLMKRPRFDARKAFDDFEKIITPANNQPTRIPVLKRMGRCPYWRAVSAGVAACLVFALAFFSFNLGKKSVVDKLADFRLNVPQSSKIQMVLPDHTQVWLNSASTLSYSKTFGLEDRNVEIDGEAYLEVSHNSELPFTISSGDLSVKVLGTKFNFKNVKNQRQACVAVLDGRIEITLNGDNRKYVLKPNQKLIFDKVSRQVKMMNSNMVHKHSAWKDGFLYYDEQSLGDIVNDLQRCYNVKISIRDTSLASRKFYCGFNVTDMSVSQILDLLCETNKLHYTKKQEIYYLYE